MIRSVQTDSDYLLSFILLVHTYHWFTVGLNSGRQIYEVMESDWFLCIIIGTTVFTLSIWTDVHDQTVCIQKSWSSLFAAHLSGFYTHQQGVKMDLSAAKGWDVRILRVTLNKENMRKNKLYMLRLTRGCGLNILHNRFFAVRWFILYISGQRNSWSDIANARADLGLAVCKYHLFWRALRRQKLIQRMTKRTKWHVRPAKTQISQCW